MSNNFKALNEDINAILLQLLTSENLVKYIYYNDTNPLAQPALEDASSLLFDSIYPYPFAPEIEEEQRTVVNVLFDEFELVNGSGGYKKGYITITVLSHIDIWRTEDGLRPILMIHEIDKLFNNQRIIGVGKLEFDRAKMLWANKKFAGYQVRYKAYDFN